MVSNKKKANSKKPASNKKNNKQKQPVNREIYRGPPVEPLVYGGLGINWPHGWLQITVKRIAGAHHKAKDRYWFSPACKKFRSMREVEKFLGCLDEVQGDDEEAWKLFRSSEK